MPCGLIAPCEVALASVSRCPETSAFRFVFATEAGEVSADLTVCFFVEQQLAWLRFIAVDRVLSADHALTAAVEAWVAAHADDVLRAAVRAS
jgi:hypothetical protein